MELTLVTQPWHLCRQRSTFDLQRKAKTHWNEVTTGFFKNILVSYFVCRYALNPTYLSPCAPSLAACTLQGTDIGPCFAAFFNTFQDKKNLGLKFTRTNAYLKIRAFLDFDWAESKEARQSTTGFSITANKTPISLKSVRQSIVALSSVETEDISLSTTTK